MFIPLLTVEVNKLRELRGHKTKQGQIGPRDVRNRTLQNYSRHSFSLPIYYFGPTGGRGRLSASDK